MPIESVEQSHVIILSTSRSIFHAALVEENDEYLATHGGDPNVAELFEEQVEFRFLESMSSWSFFCATVGGTTGDAGATVLRLKATPDLVIVSGLSEYLKEKRNVG